MSCLSWKTKRFFSKRDRHGRCLGSVPLLGGAVIKAFVVCVKEDVEVGEIAVTLIKILDKEGGLLIVPSLPPSHRILSYICLS